MPASVFAISNLRINVTTEADASKCNYKRKKNSDWTLHVSHWYYC